MKKGKQKGCCASLSSSSSSNSTSSDGGGGIEGRSANLCFQYSVVVLFVHNCTDGKLVKTSYE